MRFIEYARRRRQSHRIARLIRYADDYRDGNRDADTAVGVVVIIVMAGYFLAPLIDIHF